MRIQGLPYWTVWGAHLLSVSYHLQGVRSSTSHQCGFPMSAPVYITLEFASSALLAKLERRHPQASLISRLPLYTDPPAPLLCLPHRPKLIMMSASPSWIRENRSGVTSLQTWKARAKASSTVWGSRSGV